MSYRAPVEDHLFCMHMAGLEDIAQYPGCADAGMETARAIVGECARFNESVTAPLNHAGDRSGAHWEAGKVTCAPGFKDAFRQFAEAGWQGLQHPTEYGGQGLPKTIAAACTEILHSANMSFALCPLLTDGAIEALMTAGSPEQRTRYVPKLISGEWTGTMNLTEPQAGSDLALVRSRAEPQADGSYRISGQKIYITYGEHDLADDILHLVLARVPSAPEGVKGISLFLVPKRLHSEDGKTVRRNDVFCASIEHKLGIKASPTAVMVYGAGNGEVGPGAIGYLVGEENRGLEYMFVMMNVERFAVGIEGAAITERAYQKAAQYAKDRVQSRPVDGSRAAAVPIVEHPDVRRMLMSMRAYAQACRALSITAAAANDRAHHHPDPEVRQQQRALYEFLVPLVKGYSTEISLEATSLGVQVHGGMGFIEETGAAQFYRDARILTIYEGTTAIQANDLVGRKTARDGGRTALQVADAVEETERALLACGSVAGRAVGIRLGTARKAFIEVVDFVVKNARSNPNPVHAGSVPYLMLAGTLVGGWQLARALLATETGAAAESGADQNFLRIKAVTARFFADHMLSRAGAWRDAVLEGSESTLALAAQDY